MEQVYAALEKVAGAIEELGDRLGEWVSEKVKEQAPPGGRFVADAVSAAAFVSAGAAAEAPSQPQAAEAPEQAPEQAEPQPEQAEPPAEPETPPTV